MPYKRLVKKVSKSGFLNSTLEKESRESGDLNLLRNQNFCSFAFSYSGIGEVKVFPAEGTVITFCWNRTEVQ